MAYTEFYVTKGSSASPTNGGGPSLGTNDAAIYTISANCDSDGSGTTLTDNSGSNWSGVSVDDWLCFDTAGGKEFTRATTAGGGATIVVAPAVTINLTSKSVKVGGAWSTIQHASDTVTTSFVNGSGDPPRVNIKYNASSYSETVAIDTNDGTLAIPITFEGYTTNPGDYSPGDNRPLITSATHCVTITGKDYICLKALRIQSTGANTRALWLKYGAEVYYCQFADLELDGGSGTGTGLYDDGFSRGCSFIRCESLACGSHGFILNATSYARLIDCISTDAGGHGFYFNAGSLNTMHGCVADNPATDGAHAVASSRLTTVESFTVYSAGGDGVQYAAATTYPVDITGSVFSDCGGYGINLASGLMSHEDFNAFYSCTSGNRNNVFDAGTNDKTLTGDPFEDGAGGDFRPDNTANQGALLRGNGSNPPGQTANKDIGAVQHTDPAGGGGGGSSGNMTGGLQ